MEPESRDAARRRRSRGFRRLAAEFAAAVAFVGAVSLADRVTSGAAPSLPAKALAVSAPILILTIWWGLYLRQISSLDELEKAIEVHALAVAFGATVWIASSWGILTLFLGAPAVPLAMVAPLAGAVYGVVKLFVVIRYR